MEYERTGEHGVELGAPTAQPDSAPAGGKGEAPAGPDVDQTPAAADQARSAAGQDAQDVSATPEMLDALSAEVERLTAENERYREHAQRTSKLFLAATNYAEWVRESARRDAELALRKAHARVEQLEQTARGLAEKEREQARLENELERLQAAIDETRARLSAFLTAGLEALNVDEAAGDAEDAREPAFDDLRDALHSQLGSTSTPTHGFSPTVQDTTDPV